MSAGSADTACNAVAPSPVSAFAVDRIHCLSPLIPGEHFEKTVLKKPPLQGAQINYPHQAGAINKYPMPHPIRVRTISTLNSDG